VPRRKAPRRRAAVSKTQPPGVTKTGDGITKPAAPQRGPTTKRTGGAAKPRPGKKAGAPIPQSGHPFVTWYPRRRAWRAQVRHNSTLELVGMFKPDLSAKDPDTARADAAREAAFAIGNFLRTVGRGREASVDAAGRPQRPQKSAKFSSRFVGVSRDERVKDGWKAQLSVDGELVWTGYFTGPTGEEDAARAYDKEVRDRKLDRPTNFPE
jgi:hypothetical protein